MAEDPHNAHSVATLMCPAARWPQVVLIAGTLAAAWLGMQVVHELGHLLGAWATGGSVVHVELTPWTISRTDVAPNPSPLIERWFGPIVGVLMPGAAWLLVRSVGLRWSYLLRFFAGFCLIANGAYIGSGVLIPIGDAADILRERPAKWPLLLFGATAIPLGLWLWHGQGPHFGFGAARGHVDGRHTIGCVCVLVLILACELLR